ncbi:MAG: MnhB domain-containing protein [Coxiellaceae bacterium]|nr:MnhB domain-containing protein [Coxiellaceae bacterium]
MTSPIFKMAANFLLMITLIFSIWVLFRGHNSPGGGFIAGLISACGFALYLLAYGASALKKMIRINLFSLLIIGFFCVLISGIASVLQHNIFLTAVWIKLPFSSILLGSPILFDVGVYLAILSSVLMIMLSLEESYE